MTLSELCKRAGISKAEVGRRLGYHRSTVYHWGAVAPQCVVAYLELLIEYNRIRP